MAQRLVLGLSRGAKIQPDAHGTADFPRGMARKGCLAPNLWGSLGGGGRGRKTRVEGRGRTFSNLTGEANDGFSLPAGLEPWWTTTTATGPLLTISSHSNDLTFGSSVCRRHLCTRKGTRVRIWAGCVSVLRWDRRRHHRISHRRWLGWDKDRRIKDIITSIILDWVTRTGLVWE